uniref:NADH-ubiquinone oxidoreductase chain 5 n=1 Tax=Pselaphinae sp. 10 EF-2015 TaxID=1756854 RepID=A0A0S2M8S6_9COLE|nr:NADH deshydrogenase subunit 5 [Pselaphinae sp. 10 EF-2015]
MYFYLLLILSIFMFMNSLYFLIMEISMILEFELLTINSNLIVMTVLLDWMSILFMSFVMFISSMIMYYSIEYMHGDMNINRFIMLVMMFVLSMMFMIISPNLISILLGWDGLGLVSYCLVIYYQNIKSSNAGMLTALSNRVGDVALLMSIAWMMNFGSWNYYYYIECFKNDYLMNYITLFIILAAFTKSAQIPFSSWLPAAMAAPTPVSSLVHSSTLVTAGVYLLIRFNLSMNNFCLMILLFMGSLTMFMAGLAANFEFDLKKIIALSTLSQLGLMISILGLMEYKLAMFHLLTHALFKATLFMCAGSIIHNYMNCQDIRFMGSLTSLMPLTSMIFMISNLSLCGLPFLSGFYSKDLMLEVFSMNYMNMYMYMIYFLSTGFTVCYTFRLIFYLMFSEMNFISLFMIMDSSLIMLKSKFGLIFFIIFGGSMLNWMIFPAPYFICLSFYMKIMALLVSIMGGLIGLIFSNYSLSYKNYSVKNYIFSMFCGSMWNMPFISTVFISFKIIQLSKKNYEEFDQGWYEFLGAQNIYKNLMNYSMILQFIYKNNLKIYLMMMVIWVIFLIML